MKANEFVKKFGLVEAKALLAKHEKSFMPRVFDMWSDELQDFVLAEKYASFDMDDLKRLVESHELVVQCGGLEDARSHLESIRFNIATKTWFGQALLNWSMYADKLEKAIIDVESCQ